MRISFYLMYGCNQVLQSWDITYVRIVDGKVVFQTANDYRNHSFSLCRISNVEIRDK